jgi:hypothetical protein
MESPENEKQVRFLPSVNLERLDETKKRSDILENEWQESKSSPLSSLSSFSSLSSPSSLNSLSSLSSRSNESQEHGSISSSEISRKNGESIKIEIKEKHSQIYRKSDSKKDTLRSSVPNLTNNPLNKEKRKTDKRNSPSIFHKNKEKSSSRVGEGNCHSPLNFSSFENKEIGSYSSCEEPLTERTPREIYRDCVIQMFEGSNTQVETRPEAESSKSKKVKKIDSINIHELEFKSKEEILSEISKTLVYSYSFFTNEQYFFSELNKIKKIYPKEIQAFLKELVLAAFPNGIANLELGLSALNELKEGLIDDPVFNWRYLKNFSSISISKNFTILIEKDEFNQSKMPWWDFSTLIEKNESNTSKKSWDVDKFILAITTRDLDLFQAVELSDFRDFAENTKKLAKSMIDVSTHCNKTSEWITLQILSQKEQKERVALIKKFVSISYLLLKSNNFHGAMQIYSALNKDSVRPLIQEDLLNLVAYQHLFNAFDYKNNFINYRNFLFEAQKGKVFYLPIFELLTKDIEIVSSQSIPQSLRPIAKAMETFSICRAKSLSNLPDESYLKFVCGFEKIHAEILDVFYNLRNKKQMDVVSHSLINLIEWTPMTFASFLENNGCAAQIEDIFKSGICEGKDIINFLRNVPVEQRPEKLSQLGLNEEIVKVLISVLANQ